MNSLRSESLLPVAFVFHPEWWHKNYGLSFERDFFYHPKLRVEADLKMRKILKKRFGKYGIEQDTTLEPRPCIGAVHLAAGYVISEMYGCEIIFSPDSSPQVIPKNITDEEADRFEPINLFDNKTFQEIIKLIAELKKKFGYVTGDINWQGILNVALDLRGDRIFLDMIDHQERARRIFSALTRTMQEFVNFIRSETGTSSISVNRNIKYIDPTINLHSNCAVVMISPAMYQDLLLEFERELSNTLLPYGIHHCGNNMHIHAQGYARIKKATFFDVGWGSDISVCRKILPEAFLNLRYDPVKMRVAKPDEVSKDISQMIKQSAYPEKTGLCCINMGWDVPDDNILAIVKTVEEYRQRIISQ